MNIKSACLLLSLCHAGSAAALGLGAVHVQSHLGQPLRATVALLDATGDTTADCFSLQPARGGISPPLHAELSLERSASRTALHIRTAQPIHDPVTQFALISECEARLQRDYVILLDPPGVSLPAPVDETPEAVQALPSPVAAPAPPPQVRPARRAPESTPRPAAATGQRPVALRAKPVEAPRLVLSGQHRAARGGDIPFALRMDTRLPDPVPPPAGRLTATELSDENTALSRKLAYLESQLAALQQRNARLDAALHAAPPSKRLPPAPARSAQWPLYLLALGLLGGAIAFIAWLLRRQTAGQPLLLDDSPWTQPATPDADTTSAPSTEAVQAPERMPEIAPPAQTEGTVVKEDILDQAEVFMAHGHGELAIHLLQEHLNQAPTESPVPWLLLLDLLHRAGDSAGYAAASAECRRYFNINLNSHPVSQETEPGEGLEAYPHLLERLVAMWHSPDIDAFFKDLIYDDRGGTRMGFEPAAYRDILMLRAIAQQVMPSVS